MDKEHETAKRQTVALFYWKYLYKILRCTFTSPEREFLLVFLSLLATGFFPSPVNSLNLCICFKVMAHKGMSGGFATCMKHCSIHLYVTRTSHCIFYALLPYLDHCCLISPTSI